MIFILCISKMIVVCSLRSLCVKTAIIRICCAIPLPTSGELEGMFRQHWEWNVCHPWYMHGVQTDSLLRYSSTSWRVERVSWIEQQWTHKFWIAVVVVLKADVIN